MIYIGYYDLYNSTVERLFVTSAVNKIHYLLQSFCRAYDDVEVFSMCKNIETKRSFFSSEEKNDGKARIYFPISWGGGKNKLHMFILGKWLNLCLFVYLLRNAHKNEHVYVYHATSYGKSILWAKAIKQFKLILEVEEIYSEVQKKNNKSLKNYEYSYINTADAFIFSTHALNEPLNKNRKPFVVINGTYQVEEIITEKYNDDKVHIVYAGTFDVRKGGAAAAAATAEYLDDNYVIHICGFGTEEDKNYLLKLIKEMNEKSACKIIFHGLLMGNEYLSLLQKCHIGLSTQDPNAKFNATSFPSKILSYLANGLSVVSIRIPAIEMSEIGKYITYYEEQQPELIANAIKKVKFGVDYRGVIRELSNKFDKELVDLKNQLSY